MGAKTLSAAVQEPALVVPTLIVVEVPAYFLPKCGSPAQMLSVEMPLLEPPDQRRSGVHWAVQTLWVLLKQYWQLLWVSRQRLRCIDKDL